MAITRLALQFSAAVTRGVTPRWAEGFGLHGVRAIRPKMRAVQRAFGAKVRLPESREFRRVFRRGGMAEWSMAVVFKNHCNLEG
jgi:hypothetical protein